MSSTISLSTLCAAAHPVGFSTAVSVTGFPPDATLGIDVLDLDQKRIQLLSRGTVTTDATGALAAMPVQINVPEGLYFVRVFVDDGTGNPANGQPESQVTIAAPCDVLYAPTASSFERRVSFGRDHRRHRAVGADPDPRRLGAGKPAPEPGRVAGSPPVLHPRDPPGATSPSIGAYDVNTGLAISSLAVSASTQVVAMSPDGLILVLAAGSALTSVSTATMALRPQSFTEPLGHPIDALVFSPDGKTLAVTSQAVVHLLDPVALTVLKSVPIVSTSSGPASGMAAVFTNTNLLLLGIEPFRGLPGRSDDTGTDRLSHDSGRLQHVLGGPRHQHVHPPDRLFPDDRERLRVGDYRDVDSLAPVGSGRGPDGFCRPGG